MMKHACEQISLLVSESLERKLTLREKLWVKTHLLMCAACRHYFENMSKLHAFFKLKQKENTKNECLPQEKRQRIEHVLDEVNPKA